MGLLDKARELLNGWRSQPPRDRTDAVKADEFDQEMYDKLKKDAPILAEMADDLNEHFDHTDDLVRDVVLSLWQKEPEVRPKREVADSHMLNRATAAALQDSPEILNARSYTVHDDYSAAIAASGVGHTVETTLREFKERAEEAQRRKEEAKKKQQEGAEGLDGALADAPEDEEDLTEEQKEAIRQAMQDYLDAQAEADEAEVDADNLTDTIANAMGNAADAALNEASEQLGEEARLMAMWGVGEGELQSMSFKERAELAEMLRTTRLAEFSKLVGRFKLMAAAQQTKKVVEGWDDVVDVGLSDDLERVLLSEIAAAEAHPAMMLNFQRRFAEGQLLSLEYEGEEKVGNGPIVCCIDSSGSMSSQYKGVTREAWSKALALALLDEAMRLNREFHGVNFSSGSQVMEFHARRGERRVHELVKWIETFYRGGTNFEIPLRKSIKAINTAFQGEGRKRADIVFVTDGACAVSPEFLEEIEVAKMDTDFRIYGICVGGASGIASLELFCDNVRSITDLTDPSTVQDIFQSLAR